MEASKALEHAGYLINLARKDETSTGDPMTAAQKYTTAIETIMSLAAEHAQEIDDTDTRLYFLSQLRARVDIYQERAELLLFTALEEADIDKPSSGGGLAAALAAAGGTAAATAGPPPPAAQYGALHGGAASSAPVLGIPVSPETAGAGTGAGGYSDNPYRGGEPTTARYFSNDATADSTAAPPPAPPIDLDDLLRDLGAPGGP